MRPSYFIRYIQKHTVHQEGTSSSDETQLSFKINFETQSNTFSERFIANVDDYVMHLRNRVRFVTEYFTPTVPKLCK